MITKRTLALFAVLDLLAVAGAHGRHASAAARERAERASHRVRAPIDAPTTSSSVALVRVDGHTLALVADEDDGEVLSYEIDRSLPSPRLAARTLLPGKPTSVVVAPDGRVLVALREASAVDLAAIDPDSRALRVVASFPTSTEPTGMALTPDGATLVVACAAAQKVDLLALDDGGARVASIDVGREPRAVVTDDRGEIAFVSHAVGGVVTEIDLARRTATRAPLPSPSVPTPMLARKPAFKLAPMESLDLQDAFTAPTREDRHSSQGFTLAKVRGPEGEERIAVPETLVDTGDPKVVSAGYGGGGFTASTVGNVAVLDARTGAPLDARVREPIAVAFEGIFSGDDARCLLPRGSAFDAREGVLYVACVGSDQVLAFDGRARAPAARPHGQWLVPSGPSGVAVDAENAQLVVWSAFDHVLTTIDPAASGEEVARAASPTFAREATPVEVGRKLFHTTGSRRVSADGRACASCHPDGRDDGLVWSSPNGARQTPTLAGRLRDTPPYGWKGESATVREHLKQTFRRLNGSGLSDKQMYALLAYLASLAPVAPPTPAVPSESAAITRGHDVFASYDTGCSDCHDPDRAFTDGDVHRIGARGARDARDAMNTPSLVGVGRSAPYFHDGRFASLDNLLRETDGAMGFTAQLTPSDRAALLAYLRSL